MAAVKRSFRAESLIRMNAGANDDPGYAEERRHQEVLAEIASLKAMMRKGAGEQQALDPEEMGAKFMSEFRKELSEAAKLKVELDAMYEAIAQTKKEIATLHHTTGSKGEEMTRVTNELDAVVVGTEGATETILASAEFIDETANTLSARVDAADAELANDIQEKVISIFEACNFQDLTGQRITKVVATLRFVEDRIIQMMDIWGGIETFKEFEVEERNLKEGDAALLNGPALETDADVATQDDIDALFA
ncbi:protein phosphatase CheZ [Roseibium porphyridii]|uniref:Protein phosphatase CheZ n=1 Tax=Roseibium porphyridii TaxID=2866279 RepID=A0ABY8F0W8_9HYPH|nr:MULTISPECIES: protein phosphatase CheZ [Stappiaceae]QFT33770.1 chemotaxis regulator CheZ [Labrenzia sp. THAF82]WFE89024.1 protein phosphatase CheZ [Roseibium sp. KMA01]